MGLGTDTQGVVLISGMRMVDLVARKATKIETAPTEIVDEALAILVVKALDFTPDSPTFGHVLTIK
jgi:hypothetical protein